VEDLIPGPFRVWSLPFSSGTAGRGSGSTAKAGAFVKASSPKSWFSCSAAQTTRVVELFRVSCFLHNGFGVPERISYALKNFEDEEV